MNTPTPSTTQCRAAWLSVREAIERVAELRETTPRELSHHREIAQIVFFEIAPQVAAGLVERAKADPLLNRALGRRAALAAFENPMLGDALAKIARRARGLS